MQRYKHKANSEQTLSIQHRHCKLSLLVSVLCVFAFFITIHVPQSMAKHIKSSQIVSLPGKAKVIDLTQVLNEKAPSYEGKPGDFDYQVLTTVAKDGYGTGSFCMHEHFGTHMDAPVHFCKTGLSIDKLKPGNLVAPIIVIDIRKEAKKNPDYLLTVEKIKEIEKKTSIVNHAAFLLLTGWDKRYFKKGEYRNADSKGIMHFPGFSVAAAQYLIDKHKPFALGIDTLSIDYGPTEDFPVHKLVLAKGMFMIENLTNLDKLPLSGAVGIFAPLKIEGGTGSPARVLALVPQ